MSAVPEQNGARRTFRGKEMRARWEEARGHLRLDGFCDGADLVNLEQQTVAGLFLHRPLDALRVGHCQVVAHNLDADVGCELGPSCPVILVKRVFNGDHCGRGWRGTASAS